MFEKELNLDEFKNFEEKGKYVFFFTSDSCSLCKEYVKLLEPHKIPKMIKVKDDPDNLFKYGVIFTPLTIIYGSDGKPGYKVAGVLYGKQVKELQDKMMEKIQRMDQSLLSWWERMFFVSMQKWRAKDSD